MVKTICKAGQSDEVFQHLDKMCQGGTPLLKERALHLLQSFAKHKDLSMTRKIHALVVQNQIDSVPILADNLIRMFIDCGSLYEANIVFGKVVEPSIYTWNAIIKAYYTLGQPIRVFDIYDKMICEGIKPDKFIFMLMLKACSNGRDLSRATYVHNQMTELELAFDVMMGSTLVDTYAKCGNLEMAQEVFDTMTSRDKVTWNAMIGAYVHNGNGALAFEFFKKMQSQGIDPDRVTLLNVLKACTIMGSLDHGKSIHEISVSRFQQDVVVGSSLIDMYAKCGDMEAAQEVFDNLPDRNVVSWSTLIAGYTQHGQGLAALSLFGKMQQEGVKPDKVILACLLKACASVQSLEHCNMLHDEVIRNGLESDVFVVNNLFYMYSKVGSLEEARKLFDSLSDRDVISWATMIAGYAQNGQGLPALRLFNEMRRHGVTPDEVTYSCVLKACGSSGASGHGKLIHDECSRELESDVILANTLIDMYAKCGNVKAAHKLFNALPNRDVVSWNSVIAAYAQDGKGSMVFELLKEMQKEGIKPTKVTFLCILKACGSSGDLEHVKLTHGQLLSNGLVSDIAVRNSLIDTYAKCGALDVAWDIFSNLQNPDAVSWGAMIGGYVHNGQNDTALYLFKKMRQECVKPDSITLASVLKACSTMGALDQGKSVHEFIVKSKALGDVLVGNALVDMYAKCGSIDKAREVFDDVPKRDVISWNTMISAYTHHGMASPALELFDDMQLARVKPDDVTLLCILKACSTLTSIKQGRKVHDWVIKNNHGLSLSGGNTLLDMYVKCGNLGEGQCIFDRLPARNVVSWGVIIGGYAQHGLLTRARQCLQDMKQQGLKPDAPIHLSILAACSHAGLADEGHDHFTSMQEEYGMPPTIEHFNVLVDLLGRTGRLHEAVQVLQTVPGLPTLPAWVSLLTACKSHGNKVLGRCCFKEVSRLDPSNASGYAMMLDLHVDTNVDSDFEEDQDCVESIGEGFC